MSTSIASDVPNKSSVAQLKAAARYRERNKAELQTKARQRMALRRARLAELPGEEREAVRLKARASDARYRRRHAPSLASRQTDRRAMAYISKHGCDAWLKRRGDADDDEEDEESTRAMLRKRQARRRRGPSTQSIADSSDDALPPSPRPYK
ncbi:hypothetical protein R3P38DRAFT_3198594 [Favolaschia claudopus]|uniref:Uncharacterized protein n=1 Tax=Favolaschia claudopus TaxID=2862362 RepID=A0AAW0B5V6_9AGAR